MRRYRPKPFWLASVVAAIALGAMALVWPATTHAADSGMAMPTSTATPSGPPPSGQQVATVRYGPFHIPGGSPRAPGELFNWPTINLQPPCTGCELTSMTPGLVYADGSTANMDTGPMLHHFVLLKQGGVDTSCRALSIAQRIWASGNERTPMQLPPGYGLPVGAGEKWALITDLMNYSTASQTVYVTITATYVPGAGLKPVVPVWLDVAALPGSGCSISYYPVPAGESHQSHIWVSSLSGRVVHAGGHLHGGGTHISTTDVTTNTPICDSVATPMTMYGDQEIAAMTTCTGDPVAIIHKGDKIRLDAYYDTTSFRPEAMGISIIYVAPDS